MQRNRSVQHRVHFQFDQQIWRGEYGNAYPGNGGTGAAPSFAPARALPSTSSGFLSGDQSTMNIVTRTTPSKVPSTYASAVAALR